jgi:HK97 gp10 family phage protein
MQGGGLMPASFEVEGLAQIQKRIEELGKQGRRIENDAIQAGAKIVAERMRREVPVSNIAHLHIRDDIHVSKTKRQQGIAYAEVGPGQETAWRARFLEFGTVKMAPRPFISKAGELSRNKALEAIKQELRKGLGL